MTPPLALPAMPASSTSTLELRSDSQIEGGTPGRSRTCGLPLRKGPLYPAELRGPGQAILLGSFGTLQPNAPIESFLALSGANRG